MEHFQFFNSELQNQLVQQRQGETKFGQRIRLPFENESLDDFLNSTPASYILFGICEDIGVKANFGRVGARQAWQSSLKALLNIQHNKLCKGSWVGVLGHFDFSDWQKKADTLNPSIPEQRNELFSLVSLIDKEITHLVNKIVQAQKIPIIIGGGHNNAYGNIKGLALANQSAVNVINLDAHTDFRPLEGRHSGNGFSYAFHEGFLENYFIFGLHENYTSKGIFHSIKEAQGRVKFNTLEEIKIRSEKNFVSEMHLGLHHIKKNKYGIEIDLDSIENVASSAITPTGFSTLEARQFVSFMGNHKNANYLHICEGAPNLDNDKNPHLVGKLTAYFITDFIKARENTK